MAKTVPAATRGLDDFRAQFDKNVIVPAKIRAGLEKLAKRRATGDAWETELDFLKTAGLSTTDLAGFREGFVDFYVNVGSERSPKRVWFGTRAAAAKGRASL